MSAAPTNSKSPPLQSAILFISRVGIKQTMRQILREQQVTEVLIPNDPEEAITMLKTRTLVPFIVDFEHGPALINKLLGEAQSPANASLREIYLIAAESRNDVVIMAAEYNVTRVHVGEISKNNIVADLNFIAARVATPSPLKQILADVSVLRKSGETLQAIDKLREGLSMDPSSIRLALELSESLTQVEVWDEAARLAEDVLNREESNLRAMHLLARCNMKQGQTVEAVQLLEKAAAFNRLKVDRLLDFGNVLLQTGRYQEAAKQFELASEVDEDSKEAMKGQGQCKLMIGEVNDALEILRDAADGHEIAGIFNASAILAIKQGQYSNGIKLYKVALTSVANSPKLAARLHYNLGLAHYKSGQMPEALQCFIAAAQADTQFEAAVNNAKVLSSLTGTKLPGALQAIIDSSSLKSRKSAFQGSITDFISEFDQDFQEERTFG